MQEKRIPQRSESYLHCWQPYSSYLDLPLLCLGIQLFILCVGNDTSLGAWFRQGLPQKLAGLRPVHTLSICLSQGFVQCVSADTGFLFLFVDSPTLHGHNRPFQISLTLYWPEHAAHLYLSSCFHDGRQILIAHVPVWQKWALSCRLCDFIGSFGLNSHSPGGWQTTLLVDYGAG